MMFQAKQNVEKIPEKFCHENVKRSTLHMSILAFDSSTYINIAYLGTLQPALVPPDSWLLSKNEMTPHICKWHVCLRK